MTPLVAALVWVMPLLLVGSALLTWRKPTRWAWLLHVLPSLALGGLLLVTAIWAQSATWMQPVVWISVAALLLSAWRWPGLPAGRMGVWDAAFTGLVLVLLLPVVAEGLRGHRIPPNPVALGPVLAGGPFMVGQGGSTPAVNYHVAHPHMRYAADLIGIGPSERHARGGLIPADPSRYAIFGAAVLAPLDGVVVAAQGDLPDWPVPERDPENPAGNHVVLRGTDGQGREVTVLLAHLRRGSVTVRPGDRVRRGQRLGQVGNSGNTTEPHLHVGVNVGAQPGDPLSGEGVPFTLDGVFPVRGMTLRGPAR